jgi:TatA/E family protein of Tat protein translocase
MEPFAFLGTQEVVVVLVLALLVFGPQKLPDIGRQLGTAMRELKKLTGDFQQTLDFDTPSAPPVNPNAKRDWYAIESVTAPALPSADAAAFIAPPGPSGMADAPGALGERQGVLEG